VESKTSEPTPEVSTLAPQQNINKSALTDHALQENHVISWADASVINSGVPKTRRDRRDRGDAASLRQRGYCSVCSVRRMQLCKTELLWLSVSYCCLYLLIFRNSQLINVILQFCFVWLGLPEATSAAISRLAASCLCRFGLSHNYRLQYMPLPSREWHSPFAMRTSSSKQLRVPRCDWLPQRTTTESN